MITGITGIDNFGEQALAQMAQMALSNQLNEAEQLKIFVKTDAGKLAQGELEWLAIDGKGLVMRESLRMQEDDGRIIVLKDVQYLEGKELSPELTSILLEKAKTILNLRNFEMQGISLCIRQLEVTEGLLTLQAAANVTKFPSL